MPVRFVAYVDESGDTGIESVKPFDDRGASEWLVLSCFLVREEHDHKTLGWVREILGKFTNNQSKHLHFAGLIESKKRIACEVIAQKECRFFIVASNKKNIVGYRNPRLDKRNKAWIYWWLSRLMLERVTEFCEQHVSPDERGRETVRIIFSRRGGLTYADFAAYLRKIRLQSTLGHLHIDAGDLSWSVVDPEEIFVLDHKQRAGLQLADIGAGAFFQALERNRPGECDPQYAQLLSPRMGRNHKQEVIGYGLKTMPEPRKMGLAVPQRAIFDFYGYKGKW